MAKWRENLGLPEPEPDGRSKNRWWKFYRYMVDNCYVEGGRYFQKYHVYPEWTKNFWSFVFFVDSLKRKEVVKGKRLSRKDQQKDFFPDNLAFHTQKEITWKRKATHKIEIDGVIKHIPEIKEILRLQGIKIDESTLRSRHKKYRNNRDVGEVNTVYGGCFWKGEYRSLKQICKEENSNYQRAKCWMSKNKTVEQAVELAKTKHGYPEVKYIYNEIEYNRQSLAKVLSKELNQLPRTIEQRLYKGMNIEELKEKPFRKSSRNIN